MLTLLRKFPTILAFSSLQIFFTAPGQTFLISLFVTPIFKEIGISNSLFAGIYSAATMSAALFLNPAGRIIDKYPVKKIIIINSILMALGCTILAMSNGVLMLLAAFFLLRLFGQGVYGLTGSTLIAKKFDRNRGTAMGIMTLGFPLSEAVFPTIALTLLSLFGWRGSYIIFAIGTLLIKLPIQSTLLNRSNLKEGEFLPGEKLSEEEHNKYRSKMNLEKDYTLKDVLRDVRFYLILIASCVPPVVMTALLFHQGSVFSGNNWPISLAATGLGIYAFFKAATSVITGPIVDKFGPFTPFFMLIFMIGLGTLITAIGGPTWFVFVYFGLMGAALGISSPAVNVVYARLYGVTHIGSIKGFVQTFRNGLTALGPLPIAMALDYGIATSTILFWIAGGIFVLSTFPLIVKKLS